MADTAFTDTSRGRPFKERFIGDKNFYKLVFGVAVPIIVQNGISNFVGLLDNVMVGAVGTEQMTGVSIANQLIFIYNLCVFGGLSGVGIFTAQFFGKRDDEGVRDSFRMKLWTGVVLTLIATAILLLFSAPLIGLYLNEEGVSENALLTLGYGEAYMRLIVLSFLPFMLLQVYASTLRECGETLLPMKASLIAVTTNLFLNWVLIYGHFGLPALGVVGAAWATLIARIVEVLIVVIYAHTHKEKHTWVADLYRTVKVRRTYLKEYVTKGFPILANEALWSTGISFLAQCYSMRGLAVVAALNIANTVNNCLNVVFLSFGSSVGIIVGQLLGAGRLQEAKDTDNKMLFTNVLMSLVTSVLLVAVSGVFPKVYNTTEEVRAIATSFLIAYACFAPQNAFNNACYFTLRCGGKTMLTFVYDCLMIWVVNIPIAFVLSRFTSMPAVWIYICVSLADLVKVAVGVTMIRKNIWIQNIVKEA